MCGRFSLTTPAHALNKLFDVSVTRNLAPRYNIAPMQPVEIIRQDIAGRRTLTPVQWGLIPHWAKEPTMAAKLINARSETVNEKPSFRGAFRHRRCLIPADSFYEWQRQPSGRKQPFRLYPASGDVFAFAGLWETWMGADGSEVETCSILTTDASADIAAIHHRMPVILAPEDFAAWFDPEARPKDLMPLLTAAPFGSVDVYPVSPDVGKVQNDGPYLHDPVTLLDQTSAPASQGDLFG